LIVQRNKHNLPASQQPTTYNLQTQQQHNKHYNTATMSRDVVSRELLEILWKKPIPERRVHDLLREEHLAARVADAYDQYPLHIACATEATIRCVQMITKAWPGALRQLTAEDEMPLHLAATKQAPLPILKFLIDQYKGALTCSNRRNELPIHLLIRGPERASLEAVEYLIHQAPSSLKSKDRNRETPLHLACAKNQPHLALMKALLKACPEAAHMVNSKGDMPLHAAAAAHVSKTIEAVWEALVEAHPQALLVANAAGETPLHIALQQHGVEATSLSVFWKEERVSLRKGDAQGNSPLHLACILRLPINVLRELVQADPNGVTQRNDEGQTAFHILCLQAANTSRPENPGLPGWIRTGRDEDATVTANRASGGASSTSATAVMIERMTLFVKAKSSILNRRNTLGQTPLHVVCGQPDAATPIVRYVLGEYPEALRQHDNKGQLPIHMACRQAKVSYAVIQILVNGWRLTMPVTDPDGDTSNSSGSEDHDRRSTWRAKKRTPSKTNSVHRHGRGKRSGSWSDSSCLMETTVTGNTPLHLACRYGVPFDVLQFLVHHGPACVYMVNGAGMTPLQLAKEHATDARVKGWVGRLLEAKASA
jgi:ankyrin repeat protein